MNVNDAATLDPDAWFRAWQCFQQGMAEAPADTPPEAVADFARQLRRRCPCWPPPLESMQRIQKDWLLGHPGQPLPPGLFGAAHGLWVPGEV